MPNKLLVEFSDGAYGWSESYFDSKNKNDLQGTLNAGRELVNLRSQMLAKVSASNTCTGPKIVRVTASALDDTRYTLTSMEQTGLKTSNIKGSGGGSDAPDNPYSAVQMILTNDRNHQSKRLISGVPDDAIGDQELKKNHGFFGLAVNFMEYLTAAGSPWGSSVPALAADTKITAATNTATGQAQLTLAAPLAPPGDQCSYVLVVSKYKGQPGSPSINGIERYDPDDANTIWTGFRRMAPLQPICMGVARLYVPAWSKFINGYFGEPRKKNRGRPSNGPRGRSKRKR